MERKTEYTIVGTIAGCGDFLICLVGSDKARAEASLKEITTNPDKRREYKIDNYTNVRLNEEYSDDCWWNYGTN